MQGMNLRYRVCPILYESQLLKYQLYIFVYNTQTEGYSNPTSQQNAPSLDEFPNTSLCGELQ